jgi:galactitol-specific phosphotransferase system IIB component
VLSSGDVVGQPQPSRLLPQVLRYFKKEGFSIEQDATTFDGFSGITQKFDLVVQKGHVTQGVWIRDWNRTIGVNIIINIDKASSDVGLASPIIVGEKFSDHAKAYANRRKITLLTTQQVMMRLR